MVSAAAIARLVRSSLLETLGQDFIRTAWAKGLPGHLVIAKHALRAALGPVLSVIGLQFGFMLSGAFIVEVVFAWHGVGELAVIAIQTRDFPLIQGVVVTVAVTYVVINAAVDLLSRLARPAGRLRMSPAADGAVAGARAAAPGGGRPSRGSARPGPAGSAARSRCSSSRSPRSGRRSIRSTPIAWRWASGCARRRPSTRWAPTSSAAIFSRA